MGDRVGQEYVIIGAANMDDTLLEEDLIDDSLVTGNFPRRGGPQAGRRKGKASSENTRVPNVGTDSPSSRARQSASRSSTPISNKKASAGWGEDEESEGGGGDVEMFGGASKFTFDDNPHDDEVDLRRSGSDDNMPIIPDLDDQREEDMLTQVANAPTSVGGRVETLRELEKDMKKSFGATLRESGIDLSLLATHIYEPAVVSEEMNPWTWDTLFTSVSSELRTLDEKNGGVQAAPVVPSNKQITAAK